MGTKVQHRREYDPIGRLLRRMREARDLSQREFAEKIKWRQSAVHKSETGERRVDLCELVMWTRACGADPREVLDRYLEAVYPGGATKATPEIRWPFELQEKPVEARDEALAKLLDKASSLVRDGKPAARRRKK